MSESKKKMQSEKISEFENEKEIEQKEVSDREKEERKIEL